MARLSLRLLGGFQLRLGSRPLAVPAKKVQALLAYLALRPGSPHTRDTLTGLFWGETGQREARQSLRQAVFHLRKLFAAARNPAFVVQGETIIFNPSSVDVDVAAFERLVRKGTREALESAVTLYQGALLDGFHVREPSFEEWLRSERERLHELALEALSKLLAQQVKSGPSELAAQTAMRLLGLDPLLEPAHRTLMRLYARQGRRSAALRQYQACLAILQRELGVEPEPETRRLYQDILRQQPPQAPTRYATASRGRGSRLETASARPNILGTETPLVGRQARDLAMTALKVATESRWLTAVAYAERARARIAQADGALHEAEMYLNQALKTFASTDARFRVARMRLALAEISHGRGDRQAALAHLQEAYNQFKLLRVPRYVELTEELAKNFEVTLA